MWAVLCMFIQHVTAIRRLLTSWNRINEELKNPGQKVSKGDQIGYFQFGGSSIIVAFERERIEFDEDLEDWSRKEIMVDVEVGMSLGRAKADSVSRQIMDSVDQT